MLPKTRDFQIEVYRLSFIQVVHSVSVKNSYNSNTVKYNIKNKASNKNTSENYTAPSTAHSIATAGRKYILNGMPRPPAISKWSVGEKLLGITGLRCETWGLSYTQSVISL